MKRPNPSDGAGRVTITVRVLTTRRDLPVTLPDPTRTEPPVNDDTPTPDADRPAWTGDEEDDYERTA